MDAAPTEPLIDEVGAVLASPWVAREPAVPSLDCVPESPLELAWFLWAAPPEVCSEAWVR